MASLIVGNGLINCIFLIPFCFFSVFFHSLLLFQQPIKQSLIVKTALTNGLAFETLSAHNVFNKEIEFYDGIVPQINRLLIKLDEPDQIVAETFGVCKTNKVMLFEDLAPKGYGLSSIQRGCNISEAKVIFKKLATFHAICAVLQEEKPDIFANFKYGNYSAEKFVKFLTFDSLFQVH